MDIFHLFNLLIKLMKKILIAAYKDPFTYKWWMEIVAKKIAEWLQNNYDIHVCFQWPENSISTYQNIHTYSYRSFPMGIGDIIYAYQVKKLTQEINPDLLIDNTCVSFLNNTLQTKTISIIHGTSYGNFLTITLHSIKSIFAKIYRYFWVMIQSYYLKKCSYVVAISQRMKSEIIRYYRIDPEKVVTIENWTFINLDTDEENQIINKKLSRKIIFVSTDHKWKWIHIIESVAKAFPSIVIEVYWYNYVSSIHNIHYKWLANEKELFIAMKDCDLFLLPSQYEGQSLAILDALAIWLPVLTSKNANPSIMIDGENGYIVDNIDTQYIEKINYLYENFEKIKTIRKNNIALMKNYHRSHQVDSYLQFIHSIL